MEKVTFLAIILFLEIINVFCQQYNRSQVLEKYPELGTDFVIFLTDDGDIRIGYLNFSEPLLQSRLFGIGEYDVEKDVTFTLFTRNNLEGHELKDINDLPDDFDKNKKTKFVTHGWMAKGNSSSCINIKNGFLDTSDVNVFVVDWSPIADNSFYPIPARATWSVGQHYGKFLNHLVDDVGVDPKDIHLIGHSLGAHISGFAGRSLHNDRVARITGLDPASPGFDVSLVEGGRLDKNDSDFVDVIHTCAGFLGIRQAIGHADFYPNGGGPPQPGCNILEILEACSHSKSWQLFADSIVLDQPYMATQCHGLSWLGGTKDCDGEEVPMGEPTPVNTRGIFYTKTTNDGPYTGNTADFVDDNTVAR